MVEQEEPAGAPSRLRGVARSVRQAARGAARSVAAQRRARMIPPEERYLGPPAADLPEPPRPAGPRHQAGPAGSTGSTRSAGSTGPTGHPHIDKAFESSSGATSAPEPVVDNAAPGTGLSAEAVADVARSGAHAMEPAEALDERFGRPGQAFNPQHPFFLGFVGALGVFVAYGLVQVVSELTTVLTLLAVSLFLALGLEPVVEWARRKGMPRGLAIALVFFVVVALFVGFGFTVVPVLVAQGGELATEVPAYFTQVQQAEWFTRMDDRYDVVSRFAAELESQLTSGETAGILFGGVLGAGAAVVGGVFNIFTVLVLTLYFLSSMPTLRATAYRMVPRSRRQRVALLGDEISRRIGGYVIGQIAIATLNGLCTYVVLLIIGIPYPALLALVVGLFGLIPLVGATLGAIVVVVVALFSSVSDAVVVGVYYVIYQQVENYIIAPKVMQRAVSVPGALAIVAALAGGSLLGILGALIAIPLAAGLLLIVQQVIVPRQDHH